MVRMMRERDLNPVMNLWLETNIKAHDFIPGRYWEAQRELVQKLLPKAEVLVWEDLDGGLKGFCGLSEEHLEGLFVAYGAQSRGIGRELLNAAKARRDRLTLQVYQKNIRAATFYRREGFTVQKEGVDERTGEAELWMLWERIHARTTGGYPC